MEPMDLKTIKERMKNSQLYFCTHEELMAEQEKQLELLYDFNQTRPSQHELRAELLYRLLGTVGENCYIEPPSTPTGAAIPI